MNSQEQKLSKKHKAVAFLVVFLLFIVVVAFVLFMLNVMDSTMDRQPRKLSRFIGHSITLKIFNGTGKRYILNNTIFPKNSYLNFRYNEESKKLYIVSSNDIEMKHRNNLILMNKNLNKFLNTKIPLCKIHRNVLNDIKDIFNTKKENGLSLFLESNDDQSSIKFTIIKVDSGYKMEVLQTSSHYVELAPRNIDTDIDTFECFVKSDAEFLKEIEKLITNSIKYTTTQ